MRVSVAMAAYQGGRFIRAQLNSILPQLGPDDELVISVDPSTDDTRAVCAAVAGADARVRVLDGPGQGILANFEHALRATRGEFVFLADQDDVWLPTARRAHALAQTLAKGLQSSNRVRLTTPAQAHEVFAVMPKATLDAVQSKGAHFYDWPWPGLAHDEIHCRFVTSFATPENDVSRFLEIGRAHV